MSGYVELIPWISAVVFAAGVLWASDRRIRKDLDGGLKQIRSDLNGAAARSREDARRLEDRQQNLLLALMVISPRRRDRAILSKLLRR
jgi:hypothetical protein